MEDENQIRNELVELLHEIVDALETESFVGLRDEDVRQYQIRAGRIQVKAACLSGKLPYSIIRGEVDSK